MAAKEKRPACSAAVLLLGPVGSNSLCLLNLTWHHRLSGTKLHMSLDGVWPQHSVDQITVSFVYCCVTVREKFPIKYVLAEFSDISFLFIGIDQFVRLML